MLRNGTPSRDFSLRSRSAPEWLVSVRDVEEANRAARFGVSILDLKEPSRGPLASVSSETLTGIDDWYRALPRRRRAVLRLSAALGEGEQAICAAGDVPAGFHFAKAGPSNCDSPKRLLRLWEALRQRLPASVELVAVAYADSQDAGSLEPELILETAVAHGIRRLLIDTFVKDGRSTVDLLDTGRLQKLGTLARQSGLWWALAGSVRADQIQPLSGLFPDPRSRPDCIGVRGAVCDQNRTGSLSDQRMEAWQRLHRHAFVLIGAL